MGVTLENVIGPDGMVRPGIAQRNFDRLAEAVPSIGEGRVASIRFGATDVTFTASNYSAFVVVSHGLAVVPAAVIVGGWYVAGVNDGYGFTDDGTWTDAAFTLGAKASAAWTGTATVSWVAIG
jgi:hypothetical protein